MTPPKRSRLRAKSSSMLDCNICLVYLNVSQSYISMSQQTYEHAQDGSRGATVGAQLRRVHFDSPSEGIHEQHCDYLQLLVGHGLTIHPAIFPSKFTLRNGLPYTGIATSEQINTGEVLIRVPESLVLSSIKAQQEPLLQDVYGDSFFQSDSYGWEDRLLVVYCLYILAQKDEGSVWYQMVRRFPAECDIVCFWEKEELQAFKDKTIQSAAEIDLLSFEAEWQEFLDCQARHPLLQSDTFSKDNYRRMFINISNRSFGKSLSFVTLVPFAQLFNHHCSKTYYAVEEKEETGFIGSGVEEGKDSSSGSEDSNDYILQGQFSYGDLQYTPYQWDIEASDTLLEKELTTVEQTADSILRLIDDALNWEDFTVLMVGFLIEKVKVVRNEYKKGRKPFAVAIREFRIVSDSLAKYLLRAEAYYQTLKHRPYKTAPPTPTILHSTQFAFPVFKKQYSSIVLKTGGDDSFKPNHQLFFRYGRNSNRTLLLRYGFAIQGNKYEHVWVSIQLKHLINVFPDVLKKVIEKRLSLYRKFKISHTRLNIDLIVFCRLTKWIYYNGESMEQIFRVTNYGREMMVIDSILALLQESLDAMEGNHDLSDKSLNYHEYFTAVYHLEKCSILHRQIHLLATIKRILLHLDKGLPKESAVASLTAQDVLLLKRYLQMML